MQIKSYFAFMRYQQVIIEYILFTRITQLIGCVWVIRQSLIFFRKLWRKGNGYFIYLYFKPVLLLRHVASHWELLLHRDMPFTVPQCECLQNDCHVLTRYTRMNIERQGFYKIYIDSYLWAIFHFHPPANIFTMVTKKK
jgi:hypothetical protein